MSTSPGEQSGSYGDSGLFTAAGEGGSGDSFTVELDNFSGPLDLLLRLVRKQQLELESLNLLEVTDQYLEYVSRLDVNRLSDGYHFLVVASTLLELKLRRLYETEDEPGDEEDELRRRLRNYALLEEAVELMERMHTDERDMHKRGAAAEFPEKRETEELEPVNLPDLVKGLRRALSRRKEAMSEEPEISLQRDRRPLETAIREVRHRITERESLDLDELLGLSRNPAELISDFLALLQLVDREMVRLQPGKRIRIEWAGDGA